MKKVRITKILNATETGKSNTNDTYVLLKKDDLYNPNDYFDVDKEQKVYDRKSGAEYIIKYKFERGTEHRINKLGKYYREKNVEPGDAIIFDIYIQKKGEKMIIIDIKKPINQYYFKCENKNFSTLSYNCEDLINNSLVSINNSVINILPFGKIHKRKRKVGLYQITVDEKSIDEDLKNNDIVCISKIDNKYKISIVKNFSVIEVDI
ncbi:hypothetical protein [Gemella sp.]